MRFRNAADAGAIVTATDELSVAMRVAVLLNRLLPRGKGAVPRWIGRKLCRGASRHIVTRHGARLVVEPSSLEVYACIINSGRTWNWHVLTACAALLRPGDTFFDIGANIGFMSLELSRIFATPPSPVPVQVVSFEPLHPLADAIRESARITPGVTIAVREEIVSDVAGTAELFLGSHSIHASTRAREAGSLALRLPTVRLDDLVATKAVQPPNVIKIDVEGGELAVFRGAQRTLRDHQPHVIFESDENGVRFGYTRRDLFAFLAELASYRFMRVNSDGSGLTPISADSDSLADPADVLATTLPDAELDAVTQRIRGWSAAGRIVLPD